MANKTTDLAASRWSAVRDRADDQLRRVGLTQWNVDEEERKSRLNEFGNYLNSGNWTTEDNQKYRSSAYKAVEDLTSEMKNYKKGSSEYQTLDGYKNYYENSLKDFDRMDVGVNANNYILADAWHSPEDYENQRSALQASIDSIQAEMDALGETESSDYKKLQSYRDWYQTIMDGGEDGYGLTQREEMDRRFGTADEYVQFQRSLDYNNHVQAKDTLAKTQEELKTARAEFEQAQNDFNLGNISYQDLALADQKVKQLEDNVATITDEVAGLEKNQRALIYANYLATYGEDADYEKIVNDLIEARNKATNPAERAKLDLQIRVLAGENEEALTDDNQLDDSTLYGRSKLRKYDRDTAQQRVDEIDARLKELDAAQTKAGALFTDVSFGGTGLGIHQGESRPDESKEANELRAERANLQRLLNKSAAIQEQKNIEEKLPQTPNYEHFVEVGRNSTVKNGDVYAYKLPGYDEEKASLTKGYAESMTGNLGDFAAIAEDENYKQLADMFYAAVGAEVEGIDIGYTVKDLMDAYGGELAQIKGLKLADEISKIDSDFLRWNAQVLGVGTQAGLNQFASGVQQAFSSDYIAPNSTAVMGQAVRQDIGEQYGDQKFLKGASTGGSNLSQILFDTVQTTANMLPMIAASTLLTAGLGELGVAAAAAEKAGELSGAALMSVSSAGNSYQQALAEGWDKRDARLFSTLMGAAEGGLQYFLGGISKFGGVGEEGVLKLAQGINSGLVRWVAETGTHIASEVNEELLQNRLERLLTNYLFNNGEDTIWDCLKWDDDDWYTVLVTTLSTGALEGPGTAVNLHNSAKLGRQLSGEVAALSDREAEKIKGKIESKQALTAQEQNKMVLSEIGKAMQGDPALNFTLLSIGTTMMDEGSMAYDLATRMQEGKAAKNAINYGTLYSEIVNSFVERSEKYGYDAAMMAVISGADMYHEQKAQVDVVEAAEKQAAEVRKSNPNAEVLSANATELTKYGIRNPAVANEFGSLINKALSGTKLTSSEMQKLLGDSTAAQASRIMLDKVMGNTAISDAIKNDDHEGAKVAIENVLKASREAKAARAAEMNTAVAEAAQAAANKVEVMSAAEMTDPSISLGQEFVPQSTVDAVQKAEAEVESAKRRLDEIKKMSFRDIANLKYAEKSSPDNAGLTQGAINMKTLIDLSRQMEILQQQADKLSAIKMPSKENRTRLADIRQQQAAIKEQYELANQRIVDNAIARAEEARKAEEAARVDESAKLARNTSDAVDTIILPNSGEQITREEYINDAVNRAVEENGGITPEEIEAIKAEANKQFDIEAEKSGGKVIEDGRGNESSAPDEGRNAVGTPVDSGENSERGDQSGRAHDRGTPAGGIELFAADSVNGTAYATKGSTVTDGDHADLLYEKYNRLEDLTQSLKDSGFTSIRYVTNGQIKVRDKETGKAVPVAAIVKGTELVLNLDFAKKGYDYVATAEHERNHLRLRFLSRYLGKNEARSFVTATLQGVLGQQQYEKAFMKYLAKYAPLYSGDADTIAHMVNEEMFCDMVAGINEFGTRLGQMSPQANEFLRGANFAEYTTWLAKEEGSAVDEELDEDYTEDLEPQLTYDRTETNAMPYGLQMKEKIDPTDPFRRDIDTSKPAEARPLPGEDALHEEQQLMSIQGMAEATGFELIENDEGYPYGLRNLKTGEIVNNVTPDMMIDTPIGNLVQTSINNGFINETAAAKEYKMLADVMNLILKNKDAALTWELVGSQLFSGVKKNSDAQYNWTIDFGTICRKTQALVDAMSATMKKLGHGLSRREIEAVYLETGLAGEATPCPVCYVFSRWMGIGGLLDQINTFQDTYFKVNPDGSFTWADGKSEQDLANFMNEVDASIVEWAKLKEKKDFFKDGNAEDKFARDNLNFGKILSDMKSSPNRRQADAIKKINDSRQAQLLINEMEKRAAESDPESAARILKSADTMREFVLSDEQIKDLQAKEEQAEEELAVFELYQWADRAVLQRVPGKLNANGEREFQWKLHPDYRPVPQSILFDLNKGADFAKDYARTWAFRTGKGNAMGKAIVPYSDARVGETIQGVAKGDVKLFNEEMLEKLPEGDKKALKAALKGVSILSGPTLNPFLNEQEKTRDKIMTKAIESMRRQNLIGGMRLQSTSDFRFEWGSDYLITFFELQSMGANVQLYTKVIEAVDFLASTGADCNLSVMPLGDGYVVDPATGKKVLSFSNVTGINAEEAIKKAQQYDNVQLILVGINDENIRLALEGTDVTFVIPFHGSGQSVDQVQTLVNLLGENLDVTTAQDYSDVQDDHVSKNQTPEQKAMWNLRMDIIQGKLWKKPTKKNPGGNKPLTAEQQVLLNKNPHLARLYDLFYNESPDLERFTPGMLNPDGTSIAYHCFLGKEQAAKIFPYEYWDTSLDYDHADGNGENFKAYCASMGIIPRFSGIDAEGNAVDHGNFANSKGYWKLLIDRKMYNNKYDSNGNWIGYGSYRNQQKINASNIKIENLDPTQVNETIPENARTKDIHPEKTANIVEKSVQRIERMREEGDIYDTKKISKDFRQARLDANQEMREAEQARASLQEGEEITISIPDGTIRETGEPVNFVEKLLDGTKWGETRDHNHMAYKNWVGLTKDGMVYGRVKFGKPYQITKDSPEYAHAFIEGTEYDIPEGGSKWFYPVEAKQVFKNPVPNTPNGNYGKYTIPAKGADLTSRTASRYNENTQMRFSRQEGDNNGRAENTVDAAATRRVVDKVNQLLPGNDWARSFVEAARSGNSGVDAGSAWRADEKRQQRVTDFAAYFFKSNKYAGFQIDRAVDPNSQTLLFEYGVPDFLNWFFTELAKDPEGLEISLNANLDNADKFFKGIDKALDLYEEPEYPTGHNWTKEDEAYMKAIEENDIATLDKMVKQFARKAGFNKEFYQHAGEHFTEFSKGEFGFHLGSWTQAAEFLKRSYNSFWNPRSTSGDPHLSLHLYADVHKPYVLPKIDLWGDGSSFRNDYNTWFTSTIAYELSKDPKFEKYKDVLDDIARDDNGDSDNYNSRNRKRITAILEKEGYDALQYTNAAEGNKKRDSAKAYILWNPEQIKSADLITYDEKGNVIPISKRFNPVDTEFRYSAQEEDTTPSNPFPKDSLMGDLMNLALNGDTQQMETWLNREMNKYNKKREQAKVIPPRVPSRDFVPRVTEEEKAALEKERLDRIGRYGAHNPSDQRVSDDYVLPKKAGKDIGQRKYYQNAGSAVNVMNEPARDVIKRSALVDEVATYDIDHNDVDIKAAKKKIEDRGYKYCLDQFLEQAEDMTWSGFGENSITKVLAMGQQLQIEAAANGTYRDLLELQASLALLSTQAGKSLQAFQMLKKSGPMGQLYYVQKTVNQLNNKKYAKLIEGKKMSAITVDPDLEKAVVFAKTEKERDAAMDKLIASIAKQVPVTVKDKWDTWRHFAMLGNARTHIRNVFGNAIFIPLRFAKDLMATTGESLAVQAGLMKAEDRTKAFVVSRDLREFAKKDALVMQKELQGNGKYNPAQEILDARQIFTWRGLDKASKTNGKWLEKEDWWFLAPAYEKALGMALQNSGYSVKELQTTIDGQKALNKARRIAIEEAQRATYRDFSVAAAALNRLKRGGGAAGILLEGVLPFTKTPINILRRGVEYSPVGIATALYGLAKDYRNGSIDAAKFIDRMSAGLSGTMLAALGILLAKLGWLRGKKDDKEEEFDKLQGYQDYSLQIGDVSMTIDWAAPGALPLFTGVAAWNMVQNDEELQMADLWDAMLLIAEPMMSLSMLDGLNKTLSAASYAGENEKIASIATSALTSYLGQGMPTLLGQLARSIDGTRRQTYVEKDSKIPDAMQRFVQSSIQNKVPVWEARKAAYIDPWGREDTVNSRFLGALENFLSPSYINMVHTTDVDEEIGKLYEATKETDILPSSPTKKIGDKQLTADEYVSYAKDVGTTKYNLLAQMFSDPRYLSLSDEEKVIAIGKIYHYANYAGKYHLIPEYDIRKNGGVWVQEAEAMPNDLLRYNRIWEAIENAIKD